MTTKQNATEHLNALIQVSRTVNAHLELDAVLADVMAVTAEVMEVEASSLVLVDQDSGDLLFHITQGEKAEPMKRIRMKPGEGIVGWVVQHGKSTVVNDVEKDPRFFRNADKKSGFKTRAILCVPLATTNRLWGAIEVMNKVTGEQFGHGDVVLCEAIADLAAIAVENAMLHREIVKTERLAAIGQTVAGLAHCIKNVLNGIQGGSYMVDSGLTKHDSARLEKGWEIVKKNNAFMTDLVMDMLTYSKEREPEYEECNPNKLLEDVCDLMKAKAAERGVALVVDPGAVPDKVMLDPKGIRRCLMNLVSNAVDACVAADTKKVGLSSGPLGSDSIRIEVSDTGCGIPQEDVEKLFRMFFSTKGSKGTGLGLAVTRKIISEHKGTIKVTSAEGQGTKVALDLPVTRDLDSNAEA